MKKLFCLLTIFLVLSGCAGSDVASEVKDSGSLVWNDVQEGLAYAEALPAFQGSEKHMMLVKVDPRKFEFSLYENKSMKKAKTVREISREMKAPLVFNGAFFDENFLPLTFLKTKGKVLHKVSKAELVDGIFGLLNNGEARLFDPKIFTDAEANELDFGLQNGPVLLNAQGQVQVGTDIGKPAARTAMGLDRDGNVIVIFLKVSVLDSGNSLLLYDFARLLKDDPVLKKLGLHSVLNLDGGPSTGFMIGEKYYPEMNKVQNVVVVKPMRQRP